MNNMVTILMAYEFAFHRYKCVSLIKVHLCTFEHHETGEIVKGQGRIEPTH